MKKSLGKVVIQTHSASTADLDCDVLIFPLWQESSLPSPVKELDQKVGGLIKKKVSQGHFDPDKDKFFWMESSVTKAVRWLLISLGSKKDFKRDTLRDAYGIAAKEILNRRVETVGIPVITEKEIFEDFNAAVEGFLLGTYRFQKYQGDSKKSAGLKSLIIGCGSNQVQKKVDECLNCLVPGVEATFTARNLVNEPANVANPSHVAEMASSMARSLNLRCKILNAAELKKQGMNLIIAVGMGSDESPRMVHLEYQPKNRSKKKIALIGKGVTFDSGGLSLKPQSHMYGMKSDMAGAAAVLATMSAIAKRKLPVHVHGLIPLVENLLGQRSVKPGDVFVAHNGKSVEIENTDAEGRLILADTLSYAGKLKVDGMIDVATLTGACVVALGEDIAGMVGTDQKLMDQLREAGDRAGEKIWQLPLEKSYARLLKSDVADMKNVGGRSAASATSKIR